MDQTDFSMDTCNNLIDVFKCIKCNEPLSTTRTTLLCKNGHSYSINDGYADFLESTQDHIIARTFDSFGYEWNSFDLIRAEDEEFWEENYSTNLPLDELSEAIALDAGCGKGRFSKYVARYVKYLIAVDGSEAVISAVKNTKDSDNILIAKANLLSLPFKPESFNFISCLGVLHHLPDPQEGFKKLRSLLAPKGIMLLYLYSRDSNISLRNIALKIASLLRKITVKIPPYFDTTLFNFFVIIPAQRYIFFVKYLIIILADNSG